MHPHTKQWLDKFDDRYVKKTPYIELWREIKTQDEQIKEMKLFLVEALKSQAEMIRAEMVPNKKEEDCACDGSGKDLHGYCDCGFSYNDCREDINYKLDELINSFK